MKLLLVKNNLSYTTKTLFDNDQKAKAKLMGIRSFPTAYTKDNQQIGGLEELESWINRFEKQVVASPARLELATYGLEDRCSIQLSYGEIGASRGSRTHTTNMVNGF